VIFALDYGARQIEFTGHKSHHYPHALRLVRYRDPKEKKVFTFITNNLDLSAKTIAEIYKARWDIELFFKWVKQNLKLKTFIGTSENAVRIQIWTAAIVIYSWNTCGLNQARYFY